MIPTKFQDNWPFGSEKKIDFQYGRHGTHLGFPIEIILAIFDLKGAPMLPTKFRVNWLFGSGEEAKIYFQVGGHLGLLIGTILAILIYKSSRCFLPCLE